jgi:hypothetical protein
LDELTPYLAGKIAHFMELYRSVIRPMMVEGRVYHHTPFLSLSPAGPGPQSLWCVLEYARPDCSAAVAGIFRIDADGSGDVYVFRPRGLAPDRRYRVTPDSRGVSFEAQGSDLVRDGVRVCLEVLMTSELLVFEAI